jgi:hypothetical protein
VERSMYKKISTGRGQAIRDLMNEALNDAKWVMGRSALDKRLLEIFPEDNLAPVRAALATKFTQFAKQAQDRSTRFDLRGRINELTLLTITELEKGDAVVAPVEEETVDVGAVADDVRYGDRIGGDLDRKHDAEVRAAREVVRKANMDLS